MRMKFTGEFFVPGQSSQRIEDDHVSRYEFSKKYVQDKVVMDIACGVGYGSKLLSDEGALSVVGVDISKELVEYANKTYFAESLSYYQGDITQYGEDKSIDVVTCFETIEHVDDYRGALRNIYRVLRKNGTLIISSPSRPLTSPNAKSINDKPANKYHVREFTIEELKKDVQDVGFKVSGDGVFGQRQQHFFRWRLLMKMYAKIKTGKRGENLSPKVTPVRGLMPRYFILVATK